MSESPPSERITLSISEVSETYRRMRRIERALAEHDLTMLQLVLLHAITMHPDAPLGAHGVVLGVTSAVISGGLDRLEHQRFVERLDHRGLETRSDRRQVFARLTERGQATLDALAEIEIER